MYGSAKAEQTKAPKKESKIVSGVKKAVDSWLERVGPKSVEKHFIKAHENVLATLNSDQRKEVFAKEADAWRKQGKILGIAATVIDVGLAGFGGFFSYKRLVHLESNSDVLARYYQLKDHVNQRKDKNVILKPLSTLFSLITPDIDRKQPFISPAEYRMINALVSLPAVGSIGILVGSGPGHWLAHLAAGGAEQIGKMKAKSLNKK